MATSKNTTKTCKKSACKKTAEPAKKTRALKPVKSAKKAAAPTPEDNLKKFVRSAIAENFVKDHNGVWGHQEWLDFLNELNEKGYMPIDTDQVGMILEEKKVAFFSK